MRTTIASCASAAAQVKKNGRPYKFGAMTSRERRIIHLALQNDKEVETSSEGVAPNRYTVIKLLKARR
jgi:spoIIIJ-associated protein